jgi:GntR family transcriptional repressor for pyruvate dehydrogenase complex
MLTCGLYPEIAVARALAQRTSLVFHRVDVKRRGLEVAGQILEHIRSGRFSSGDRLPSERELAEQTGVSRPSVREALSALHLLGLLETRAGEGTFVSPVARDLAVLSEMLADLRKSDGLVAALEARRFLEKAMAELVILRKMPRGLRDMKKALEALRRAAQQRDFEAYSRANADFHAAIARATGNPVLEKTVVPLVNIMLGSLAQQLRGRQYDSDPSFFDTNLAIHQEIWSAVASNELPALLDAIDHHYELIERSL